MILLPLRHRGRPHTRILGALSPAVVPPWIGLYPVSHFTTSSQRVLWPSGREARLVRGDHDGSPVHAGSASSSTPEGASEPAGG